MKKYGSLLVGLLALAFGPATAVRANEPAVSFELAQEQSARRSQSSASQFTNQSSEQPLQIPAVATQIPVGESGSSGSASDLPPPPVAEVQGGEAEEKETTNVGDSTPAPAEPPAKSSASQSIALDFGMPAIATANHTPRHSASAPVARRSTAEFANSSQYSLHQLFEGDADSLVARAVGSAEGTRTPDGHRTPAYYGHPDPGNNVWNLGTFSYQHGARSPEEADVKQLWRLRQQADVLQQKAAARGMDLTVEEKLNGIDLANQAPLAALDRGGYIDWLDEAHQLGMRGSEAVLWARTRSFIDPDTQTWNAPGLGNNINSISSDQQRRLEAIQRAIAANPATSVTSSEAAEEVADAQSDQSTQSAEVDDAAVAQLFHYDEPDASELASDLISKPSDRSGDSAASNAVQSSDQLSTSELGLVNRILNWDLSDHLTQ